MRKQNLRTAQWCSKRLRAYVVRDGVRYWAPKDTVASSGMRVGAFNPTPHGVMVRVAGALETWCADATSPDGGR